MKHILLILIGVACFTIASVALWFNRTALATSMPLLGFVGGFYLLSFLLVIPVEMKAVGSTCVDWYRVFRPEVPK